MSGQWNYYEFKRRGRRLQSLIVLSAQMLDQNRLKSHGLLIQDILLIKNSRSRIRGKIKRMALLLRYKASMDAIKLTKYLKRKLNTFKMKRGIKNTTRKRMQASKLLKSVMVLTCADRKDKLMTMKTTVSSFQRNTTEKLLQTEK